MRNLKQDFPIFKRKINGHPLVYLDSAATSQKPQIVIDTISHYYENYNANAKRGIYPIAEEATKAVEDVRGKVAKFINAKSLEEIIFVRNATEAINLVAYSFGNQNIKNGDTITTTIMEHHANFVPWQQLAKRKKAKFEVIDIDENYEFSTPIQSGSNPNVQNSKVLAITMVSNVLGTINPIKEIIQRIRKSSIIKPDSIGVNHQSSIVLIDAAQAVPHMKVDVQDLDCDFLVFSGHKMLAGTGVGILYGKKKLLEKMPPFLFGGEMIKEVTVEKTTFRETPHKFEAGTLSVADIVSLGAAIEYLDAIGMEKVRKHERKLVEYCLEKMKSIDGLTIFGHQNVQYAGIPDRERAGVISFTLDGIHSHDIAQILGDMGICIRAGHHCAMPLHNRLGVSATARASFYIYNDESDMDALIEGLKEVVDIFKK